MNKAEVAKIDVSDSAAQFVGKTPEYIRGFKEAVSKMNKDETACSNYVQGFRDAKALAEGKV